MTQLERLIQEVDALSAEEKARLFDHLAQQLDEAADPLLGEEWQAEIARRVEQYESGGVAAEDLGEVLTQVRNELAGR